MTIGIAIYKIIKKDDGFYVTASFDGRHLGELGPFYSKEEAQEIVGEILEENRCLGAKDVNPKPN